jgi:MFS family permease
MRGHRQSDGRLRPSAWAILVYMAGMGATFGIYATAFGAIWPELYGTRHLGAIKSAVTAMMVFSTALGPGISGWLIDAGIPYPHMIAAMGFYAVIAMLVMIAAVGIAQRRISDRAVSSQPIAIG